MPTVLREDGYRFFFYSNEGDPREPIHIHVMRGGAEAKFWLGPPVELARSAGFKARDLREITQKVILHHATIERAWYDHFA